MKKSKKLVIFGAGETAELAYEYFTNDSEFEVAGFSVNAEFLDKKELFGLPVIEFKEVKDFFPTSKYFAFVAIGASKLNRIRSTFFILVKKLGYTCASYISSKSFIWHNVIIGENCFILEDNTIQPFTTVGDNVTMWSGNHLGHRSQISNNCFISSHCVISGYCSIGANSFLGVNCTIEDDVKISEDNFIGAGSIIRKNTEPKSLFQETQTTLSKISTYKIFKIKCD